VTGGVGYIGSWVTKLLCDSGHQVVVLDNLSHGYKENVDKRAKLIIGDIADPKKTKEALKIVVWVMLIIAAILVLIGAIRLFL